MVPHRWYLVQAGILLQIVLPDGMISLEEM
jgi:hypothetical protein